MSEKSNMGTLDSAEKGESIINKNPQSFLNDINMYFEEMKGWVGIQ